MSPQKRRRRMISSSSVTRSPQKMKVPKEELGEEDLVEELHEELEEAGELEDGVGITVDDSVAEGEILHEEIIHEGDLVDEDVELEYVEEETEVPHMAHEVVMDGDIVEEYVEVEAAPDDDIATESLVALSRGPSNQHKTVRDFLRQTVQLNAKVRPRILRRTMNLQHEDYDDESISRNQVLHTKFPGCIPVPSTTKPLLPVAIAGSSQPHQQQRNWREEQKRMLEIYEIYDSLPDNMRENFKQLLESRGEKVPVFRRNIPKKPGFGSLYPHPRMMVPRTPVRERSLKESHGGETVTVDTGDGQRTVIMRDASDETATFPEGTQFVMTNSRGEQPRLMALVPLESEAAEQEKSHVSVDPSELVDMPELECNPEGEDEQVESESITARDPHIDVEGYGSDDADDDRNIRTGIDYILDSEGEDDAVFSEMRLTQMQPSNRRLPRDVLSSRRVILPEMRADVFGSVDVRHFGARQIDKHAPEARFCPGCKLTLKRSVYYHHTRMIKKFGVCNMFTPKRFPCGEDGCKERLGTVEKLCEHMWQIHGAPTNIKTKTFEDEAEFEVFLRELEGKGGNFRMSRGNKMIKAGLVQYFRCNRMQSVARDKTMRMCDELQAGMFGSSDHIAKEEDPFTTTISTKPHLRTEEACTAFFRKAFLQDGRIEVRYCDHHLHDDERIRLPPSVKERIHEMNAKKLPPAVIIMVLQSERERYCLRDSAVERRILALTPKDISNVLSLTGKGRKNRLNLQRRTLEIHSNASGQRTESLETESQPSIIAQADGHESRIPNGDDHLEEETEQTVEGLDKQREDERLEEAVSWVSEQELSELEQRMLEKYEENHDIILTDFQKMRRLENKKRHKRESIRHKVFTLGRYIKTPHFGDLDEENLILVNDMLKNVISICEDSQKNQSSWQGGASKRKKGENEDKSSGHHIGQEEEDGILEVDVEDLHVNMNVVSEVSTVEHPILQEIHPSILPHGTPSPTKKRGRGRPRKYDLTRVKEEELESSCTSGDAAPSYITSTPSTPSVSRTGRVIKPKIIQDL